LAVRTAWERRRDAGGEAEAAAARRRRQRRGGGGGDSPDFMRNRFSQLGCSSDLDGKRQRDAGDRSRAKGGGEDGRGNGATASGGSVTPASSYGHGSMGGKGTDGREASSPQHGASGRVDRRRAAAERQRGGGPELERQWRLGARV
jgi:hypothetical protein